MAESNINNFPLNFVPFGDIRLRVKYNLYVKQHSLSESAYSFFKEIEEQNSYSENDLYTKQPFQIRGNIRNINNPDEPVLGIFYASSFSEERYFSPPEIEPQNDIEYALEYCKGIPSVVMDEGGNPDNITDEYLENALDRAGSWPIYLGEAYIFHSNLTPDFGIELTSETYPKWFVAYSRYCIDCRSKEGVLEKPDYWD